MAQTPEAKVKVAIKRQLLSWGLINAGISNVPVSCTGWFYMPQNMGMGVSGIPDFVGAIGPLGRFFSIEAKAPGGKPTVIQLDRHAEIKLARGIVIVVDDVSQLEQLKEHL